MKREVILFYITFNKIYLYLKKVKKEVIDYFDTSSFFKNGEISDVSEFSRCLNKFIEKGKIAYGLIKPKIIVLYNDVTDSDLKFLYQAGLSPFNADDIEFTELSKIVKAITKDENIVFFDGDCYTVFKDNIKIKDIKKVDFMPTIIGHASKKYKHFADENIIWETFRGTTLKSIN